MARIKQIKGDQSGSILYINQDLFISEDVNNLKWNFTDKRLEIEGSIKLTSRTFGNIQKGELRWNDDYETIELGLQDNQFLPIGQKTVFLVKNQTGSIINKGTIVGANGTLGSSGRILITPFLADGTLPSKFLMGVTFDDILDGGDGYVVHFGEVRGINTSSFSEGDILYASSTISGGFTTTPPTSPNNIITVAIVINSHPANGVLFIRPTYGSNIKEDEGVKLDNITSGQILQYDGEFFVNRNIEDIIFSDNSIDSLENQISGVLSVTNTSIDSLELIGSTQNTSIDSLESQISGVLSVTNTSIDSLESQISDVASINTSQNNSIDSLELLDFIQNLSIDSLESQISDIVIVSNNSIDSLESQISGIVIVSNNSVDSLESQISGVSSINALQNNSIDSLELIDSIQNLSIDSLEEKISDLIDTTQNSSIDSLESQILDVDSINTSQNNSIDSLELVDSIQSLSIDSLEGQISSVLLISNNSIDSLESQISGIVVISNNSIDSLESQISEVASINTLQNNSIDSLELIDSIQNLSIDSLEGQISGILLVTNTSIDSLELLDSSQNNSIDSLEGQISNVLLVSNNSIDSLENQITPEELRNKLETLVGVNRLDASAIKNLPTGGDGDINYFNTEIINQTGGTSSTYATLTGLINGINTIYTVSEGIYVSGSLKVYLGGQLQTQGTTEDWVELSPSNGTFQFIEAPIVGDVITVVYNDIETTLATLLKTTDVKNTIEIDAGSLQLVNDVLEPGNNKIYGTNELGVKGWIENVATGGSESSIDSLESLISGVLLVTNTSIDSLELIDSTQNTSIDSLESQISGVILVMNTSIDSLELLDSSQNNSIDSLEGQISNVLLVSNNSIDSLELLDSIQNTSIDSLESQISGVISINNFQNNSIDSLESQISGIVLGTNASIDSLESQISGVASINTLQNISIDSLELVDSILNTSIDSLESQISGVVLVSNNSIDSLELLDSLQNASIDSLESQISGVSSINTLQNTSIDSLELIDFIQNTSIDSLESQISGVVSVNTLQNTSIDSLESQISGTLLVTNNSIDSLESQISNIVVISNNSIDSLEVQITSAILSNNSIDSLESQISGVSSINTSQNTSIDSLELVDSIHNSSIDSLESQISSVLLVSSNSIDSLEVQISDVASINTSQNTSIDSLEFQIFGVASVNTLQNASIDSLESQISGIVIVSNNSIDSLESQISGILLAPNISIDSLESQISGVASVNVLQNSSIDSLELVDSIQNLSIDSLESQISGIVIVSNTSIDSLESQISGVLLVSNNSIDSLEVQISGVASINTLQNTSIDSLEVQISGVASINTLQNTSIDSLESQISSIVIVSNTSIDSLESQIVISNSSIDSLEVQITSAVLSNNSIDSLESQISSTLLVTNNSIDSLEGQISGVISINTLQNASIDSLESQISGVASINTSQNSSIDSLESQISGIALIDNLQNISIDSLELVDSIQNSSIDSLELINLIQNSSIDSLELIDSRQNSSIDSLESQISGVISVNTLQNSSIDSLEVQISGISGGAITPTEIVNKLESITVEENKLSHTAIKEWGLEVTEVINIEIPDADPDQFENILGLLSLGTIFRRPTSLVSINFLTSGLFLNPEFPKYDTISILESTLLPKSIGNTWDIFFSCNTVPNILDPLLTEPYMDIMGTVLTGYENLNRILFKLDYVYNPFISENEIKVITVIENQINANKDPNPPDLITQTLGFNLIWDTDRNYGSGSSPVYNFMSGSIAGAVNGKVATMSHSSLVLPDFFTPPKPSSPLPIYSSQATMLSGQVNQVSGQYYAYTGSTSMWLYNGVATGLITNYTELIAVAGWQEWGTKPIWLTITGEAYLVGVDNLNQLTFTYNSGVVTCVNDAIIGGNIDNSNNKLDVFKLIDMPLNDNSNLTNDPILLSNTIYASSEIDFRPYVVNPISTSWTNLGSGQFSLVTNTTGSNTTGGRILLNVSSLFNRLLKSTGQITFICRFRRISTINRTTLHLIHSMNSATNEGWRFRIAMDVNNRFETRIAGTNILSPIGSFFLDEDNWTDVAFTYNQTTGLAEFYVKALDYAVPLPFQKVSQSTSIRTLVSDNATTVRFNDESQSIGTAQNLEFQYTKLYCKVLTSSEIENKMII